MAVGILLLLKHASHITPICKKQVALLIIAALPPFLSHISWTLGMSPIPHLYLTPFVFAFAGIVFGLALFRFELLKLAPVARSQALEKVGDGIVVVDLTGPL